MALPVSYYNVNFSLFESRMLSQIEKKIRYAIESRTRQDIVGSLVILERGVRVRRNCTMLTLPWKMC